MNDSNLLFIVSQPRSGSTLLQKIISNNHVINTVSEHWILLPFLSVLRTDLQQSVFDSALAAEVIHDFLKKFRMENSFIEEQRNFLLKFYEPLKTDDTLYVLDKTPRYYEILNELVRYFPQAKIIILIRDPVDVLQSIIHTWNVTSLRGLDYYARDILLAPVLLDKFYNEQANNANVIKLSYEAIIDNAAEEIKKVFDWLNVSFDKSVLDFVKNEKTSGKRGDPTGVKKYQKIVSKNEKAAGSKAYQKAWKNFIKGYKSYLNKQNLKNFTRYNFNDGINTPVFNYYFKYNSAAKKQRRINLNDVIIYLKMKLYKK